MGKLLFWVTLGFLAYSAWAYLPAQVKHMQLVGAVERVLEHGEHDRASEEILARALRSAEGLGIALDAGNVQIERGRSEGQRTIGVHFGYRMPIAWLGAREWSRRVDVTEVYAVDEAALAHQDFQRRERERAMAETGRRNAAYQADFKGRARRECGGKQGTLMITQGSHMRTVDCNVVRRWPD